MTARVYPSDVLDQAVEVLTACKQIDPALKVGALTQADFSDALAQTQAIQAQISVLELQLLDLRNKRDAQQGALWDMVKRTRAIVKGAYGDDSSEYELVGGTRRSDRKRSPRKMAS